MTDAPIEIAHAASARSAGDFRTASTEAERQADRLVHLAGLSFAVFGAPILVAIAARGHGLSTLTIAALVYGVSLLSMLSFSAAYHMNERPERGPWLRRADHAAIFLKIGGTYTPLTLLHGAAEAGWVLGLLWLGCGVGMVFKIFFAGRGDRLAILFYVAMGWSVAVLGPAVLTAMTPTGYWLILCGGLTYMIGIVFFLWDSLPFQNAIWHGFVLVATAVVFTAILGEIAAAGAF